jgi:hypothetical protein
VADRQGLDSKVHFQHFKRIIPTFIRKALYLATQHQLRLPQLNCDLTQTLFQKAGPWPTGRDALPVIRRERAVKLGVLGGRTRRAPKSF